MASFLAELPNAIIYIRWLPNTFAMTAKTLVERCTEFIEV
jgi:hypothetical protein